MIQISVDLDDALHERLAALARRQGRSLSDLVREALARFDGDHCLDERAESLRAIDGLWKDRTDLPDTDTYVRRLRRDLRFLDA